MENKLYFVKISILLESNGQVCIVVEPAISNTNLCTGGSKKCPKIICAIYIGFQNYLKFISNSWKSNTKWIFAVHYSIE